ncbi:chemotaxis protein CheW [Duganella rhizosphaerae]|uniref:chemotaxis protein CheW n=1 Tax=Duganella rhizosphaerae TaxID=2885763 RepID=UPI0030E9E07D
MDAVTANETPTRSNLVFGLGREEYAIDIALVQELCSYGPVTQLANTPGFIKGVVNLRGIIVPLIDLRISLGVGTPTYNDSTVVIMLSIADAITGIVVDRVADVVALEPAHIRPAPQMHQAASAHVMAVGSIDERMLIMLNIEAMLHDLLTLPAPALAA